VEGLFCYSQVGVAKRQRHRTATPASRVRIPSPTQKRNKRVKKQIMQSFRTELENQVVEQDIIELEQKIKQFNDGNIDEEKFRSLRLARGVYGQRQPGVQMIRIKLPYGKVTVKQLLRIADVSDRYSTGRLHTTTRQDIQIHYVSLDETPELWAELERDEITLREACGNTVRNVTASATAGIDTEEPFDVTPYAHAFFEYFLRNPIGQDFGRKIKVAFSSSEKDSAYTFMHDLGFIPKVKTENGKEIHGFKVVVGGGLGAQPFLAQTAFEFLETDQLIPFSESVLRVFDRHGERAKRQKARLKYLVKQIGLEALLELADQERKALSIQSYPIDTSGFDQPLIPKLKATPNYEIENTDKYSRWIKTNVFQQKQRGYFAVSIKLQTGDIDTKRARKLAELVKNYAGDDIRITVNQGLLLKFVRLEYIEYLYTQLDQLGLAEPGFGSTADITSCPGTDTCNLGISSSTGITRKLEEVIGEEYPDLIYNSDIDIKISGCMNSCGQHALASIGFHGSTIKSGQFIAPALQVLLGGGPTGDGAADIAEKVIKVPSKRGPEVLRYLLNDYETNANDGEYFNGYYQRNGKAYFYDLLKPLGQTDELKPTDFIDWGHNETFKPAIGVGECAGVVIDLVATLLFESEEKLDNAINAFKEGKYADSIYHSYSTLISTAKALLISKLAKTNTHAGIITAFDEQWVNTGNIFLEGKSFSDIVYRIRENEPSETFAKNYLNDAQTFYKKAEQFRTKEIVTN
jgi:sulfite reductase (ferredoxin)